MSPITVPAPIPISSPARVRSPGPVDARRPRLLLIAPASSYHSGAYVAAARRLRIDLISACDQPSMAATLNPGQGLQLDFEDPHGAVADIAAHATRHGLDALLGVDERSCALAALAAQRLGMAHNPPRAVATAHDKYLFRQALAQSNLPCPGYRLITAADDLARLAPEIDYPCVLKPLRLSASRGVIRVNDPREFMAGAGRLAAILRDIPGQPRDFLAEDYIPGPEFALEGLLENGRLHTLALFDKPRPMTGPFFEESLYVTPSGLAPDQIETLRRTTAHACTRLGLQRGPVHAELRLNGGGAWLIELATRGIGGRCSAALRFGNGAALEELILRNVLGRSAAHLPLEPGASAVMMIPIPARGRLDAVHGLKRARGAPGITAVSIDIAVGAQLLPLPEGDRYLGFIFARGHQREEVIDQLERAHSLLRFDIGLDPGAGGNKFLNTGAVTP